ncbi:MAG: glycosyltransferase family 2 protein [Parvularculaceae bacterium]|nr:glycosyltransferase family 2 protein [Parvularculaceae bacterium]
MTEKERPPNIGEPTVSVIMPAYNAAHYLEKSLPPLVAMRDRGEILEVIVVDDCSPDPTNVETAKRLGASVIVMEQNGGPGAARNHAAKIAKGDVLWLVDADVVAHDDSVKVLKASFDDEKVAAVFGSYDANPPARNFASQYKNLVHRYYHQRGRQESDSFWSGCGAIRRAVYLELGGFDGARYGRPSIEDIEFGYRMRAAGWRIRLAPTMLATHLKRWTLTEVVRTDIFQRAIPWSELIVSGRGMSDDLNVSTGERVKSVFAAFWILSLLCAALPHAWPYAFAGAAFMTLVVIVANRKLIRFFHENCGIGFTLSGVAFHQLYYVYAAVTFVLVAIAFRLRRRAPHGGESGEERSAAA